jgi:tRNA modification GTPase
MGIERTAQALKKARIVLWLTDKYDFDNEAMLREFGDFCPTDEQTVYGVVNKIDLCDGGVSADSASDMATDGSISQVVRISAKTGEGVERLLELLKSSVDATAAYAGDVLVSNQRHYEALSQANEALDSALSAMQNGLPSDLLSEDIRQVIHLLGTITGDITSDDILQNIFSHFCIGK